MTTQIFYDISPGKDRKVCYNCVSFHLYGVSTGYCGTQCRDKQAGQTCSKFEKETEERKQEKML